MTIQQCLRCGTKVFTKADGSCPACGCVSPSDASVFPEVTSEPAPITTSRHGDQRPDYLAGIRTLALIPVGILVILGCKIVHENIYQHSMPPFINNLITGLVVSCVIALGRTRWRHARKSTDGAN